MSDNLFNYISTIVELRQQGKSISLVAKELQKVPVPFKYTTIWRFIKKFEGKKVAKKQFTPLALSKHYDEINAEINRCYTCNSSATAKDVVDRLKTRGVSISTSHVRKLRQKLGFKRTTTKYCHMIREANQHIRFDFCSIYTQAGTTFSNWVFTDESIFQIGCSTKFCYVQDGDQFSRLRHRAKHPAKVHVWGGISARGRTQLAILSGNTRIDSELYCRILDKCYLPFKKTYHNDHCLLVQDNAPPHKSKYTMQKLEECGIETVKWPAESPDLNPIELVWGNMKKHISSLGIRTLDDLKVAILEYWNSITPQMCVKYIDGVRRKMLRVVEQKGKNIIEGK